MKKSKIGNEKPLFSLIFFILAIMVFFLSLGWATFSQNLLVDDVTLTVRAQADIRVTDISVATDSSFNQNEAISNWEEYNVKKVKTSVYLPNENSQIKYKIEITNFGNLPMGIYDITGLADNLEYEIVNYTLKDKLCDDQLKCNLGMQKEIYFIIKYKENGYNKDKLDYFVDLNFDFRVMHKVTYTAFDSDTSIYPQEVIDNDSFAMELQKPYPIGAKPFIAGQEVNYRYENDTLIVDNITADLEIKSKYIQRVEDLVTLSNSVNSGANFQNETFILDSNLDFTDSQSYRNSERLDFGNLNNVNDVEPLITELTNQNGTGFPPIGNFEHYFLGSLNGNNHTLENLYIHIHSNNGKPERTVASLFGFVVGGSIKNLTITGNTYTDETANIGGLVSYASNVELANVHNYVNVTSYGSGYSVGGIIGSVGNDNINLKGDNVRLENCSNHGTLQGGNHGGGIVGAIGNDSHLFVSDSYNEGTVQNSIITNAGILALSNGNCYINNSYNAGEISTNGKGTDTGIISLGGLVAANYGTTFIVNSYNKGSVTYTGTVAYNGSVAGLIGLVQGGGHILNSYNAGTIKDNTSHNYVGGIANTVTWNNDVHKQIYNTYNSGDVLGGSTRYQIGYLYNGDVKDTYYKSGGASGSNNTSAQALSETYMKITDPTNTNGLIYKLTKGRQDINLPNINNDLINHKYNSNYFNLALSDWVIDQETGYPTLK